MAKEIRLSQKIADEYRKELEHLTTVGEKEIAEKIKEARSFGDLSENAEYDAAKNEQGKLYARIAELQAILENCEIVDESELEKNQDTIHVGSRVVVLDLEFDEEETFVITVSQEANPVEGKVSEESPFGKALVNRKAGEEVTVEAPEGKIRYMIKSVERA